MTELNSVNAERAVLGACLLSHEALIEVSGILKPEDFSGLINYSAYKILLEMLTNNKPVDLITFSEEAKNRGIFDSLGGQAFLAELTQDLTPLANVSYHAEIVKDYSLRRNLLQTGGDIQKLATDPTHEISEILGKTEQAISDISLTEKYSAPLPVKNVLEKAFSKIAGTYENGISKDAYFSSGLIDVDCIITGFQPGSLNIIAARPSMGKTALALNIAQFGGTQEETVLIFSLEMTAEQLTYRMLAAQGAFDGGATLGQLQNGTMTKEQLYGLQEAVNYLGERKIFISDKSVLSASDFRAECRRFKQKHENLGLIIVDYLQLMTSGKGGRENRQYEIAEISRTLKSVAVELNCPIIALSQLSRETEKRVEKKPQLSDLRDSGAIEQDADVVILLYREDYYAAESPNLDSKAEIRIAKNRNGATGTCFATFKRDFSRFAAYCEG